MASPSAVASEAGSRQTPDTLSGTSRRQTGPWLLGPGYDALLIANVAWPLLLVMQVGDGFAGREGLGFWQIYFLTTPHRWVTLGLVFFDSERLRKRWVLYAAVAAVVVAVCLGVRLTTGTLLCLLTVDYLWNAWHFASQHHGIYRIYARRSGSKTDGFGDALAGFADLRVEKWVMRGLILYVIVRVAGATWRYAELERGLAACDWVAWGAAAGLVVRDGFLERSLPRRMYLVSVVALYSALLGAVHWQQPALVLSLATASAVFHATEYLALVSWSVRARHEAMGRRLGLLGYLAPRWGLVLAVFMLVLGAGGWMLSQRLLEPWLLVNVIVAFLHYAYDGLIWRRGA